MAIAGALMHQLGARFASPELEARYREFRTTGYFQRADGVQACIRLVILGCTFLRHLLANGASASSAISSVGLIGPAVQFLLKSEADRRGEDRLGIAAYARRRVALGALWRLAFVPFLTGAGPFYLGAGGEGGGVAQTAGFVLVESGAMGLILASVGHPLLLEHHLALQPASTVLVAIWRGRSFCRHAVAGEAERGTIAAAWRVLDGASRGVLSTMYGMEVGAGAQPSAAPACYQVVLTAYGVLSLGATTYALWVDERQSRALFLAEWRRAGRWTDEGDWDPVGVMVLLQGGLAAVGGALAWRGLTAMFVRGAGL